MVQKKKWQWLFILNIAISLALLTKGPPILMMMGSMIGLQIIFGPNRAFAIKSIFYLIPSLFPMFYWLYQIHLIGRDDFLSWLLDWYVLKRTSGTVLVKLVQWDILPYYFYYPSSYFHHLLLIRLNHGGKESNKKRN